MKRLILFLCLFLATEGFAGGFEYNSKTGLVSDKKTKLFLFKAMPDYQNDGAYVYNLFSIGGMQVCSFLKRAYSDTTLTGSSYGQMKDYYKIVFYDGSQSTADIEFIEDKMKLIEILKQANMLKGDELDENAKLAFIKKYALSATGR